MSEALFRDYNSYLRELFGCRVQKVRVDAGLSCPNRDGTVGTAGCIYCNAKGSGTGAFRLGRSITEQIAAGKSYLAKRYKARKFLAYFQSYSNTYAPLPRLRAMYEEAAAVPGVVGLTIGTRPDCVPDETLDYLAELSFRTHISMEYGLQSAHDTTLAAIGRGHSVADFTDAVRRTRARGIPVCVHVILGLPGEGPDDMNETARFIAGQDIQALKLHLLYVVRGTALHDMHRRGLYHCLTREGYSQAVGEFLARTPEEVVIQRITADPHPEELVAPAWAMEKQANIDAIRTYMATHGLRQGSSAT